MQTKNLIQTSANVIRVINLKVGDVYKRFDDSSYSRSTYYGIVKGINNNGEQTFLETIEYKKEYSTINADMKIYRGDEDLAIFPTTIDEIKDEFESVVKSLEKEIIKKQEEIDSKRKCIVETELLLSGELQNKLQSADFKSMTQAEYIEMKQKRESLLIN
jgi:hypothetical protein